MVAHRTRLIILSFILFACKGATTEPPVVPAIDPTQDNIREVVYRYLFIHKAASADSSIKVFFLALSDNVVNIHSSFGDADPTDEFLSRFQTSVPAVKKYSQCTLAMEGVFDTQTGVRGVLFRAGPITVIDSTHAEIEAGYFMAGLGASGDTLQLQKSDGLWIVTKDMVRWIA
jgi:hypothetical protein